MLRRQLFYWYVIERNLANRRFVTLKYMEYTIRCNPMHPMHTLVGLSGFKSRANAFLVFPTIVFYYFSLSLLSVYRLVLWGWGLWTDRVSITLSQPCTADIFEMIIIIYILHLILYSIHSNATDQR